MTTRVFHRSKYVDVRYVGVRMNTLTKLMGIQTYNAVAGAAEWVKLRSQQIVPLGLKPEHLLHDSARVLKKGETVGDFGTGGKANVSGNVVYGNSKVKYARIQHENRSYKHRNGRTYNYLYRALMECKSKRILQMQVKQRWNAISVLRK